MWFESGLSLASVPQLACVTPKWTRGRFRSGSDVKETGKYIMNDHTSANKIKKYIRNDRREDERRRKNKEIHKK